MWLEKMSVDVKLILYISVSQPFLPRGTLDQLCHCLATPLDAIK